MALHHIVGLNLLAYRRARGLSQTALAELLGVHWTYVSALERGTHNLTLRTVERLAARAGMDPMDLFAPPR